MYSINPHLRKEDTPISTLFYDLCAKFQQSSLVQFNQHNSLITRNESPINER